MQNLSEVLQQFQKQYANKANLAEIIESIGQDDDIRTFWDAHQNDLKADAFQLKMGDLYEFIQLLLNNLVQVDAFYNISVLILPI